MNFKKVHIYLFSGTGNTYLVAKAIKRILTSNNIEVNVYPIPGDFILPDTDTAIGFAFPTAFFSTYPFVFDFLENLPQGDKHEVFMFSSMAGSSLNMPEQIRRILVAKNYSPIGQALIKMPANYGKNQTAITIKSQSIIDSSVTYSENFAGLLLTHKASWQRKFAPWANFLSKRAKGTFFWRFFNRQYPLTIDQDACQHCGLCKKICPVGAIDQDADNNYHIGDKCCSCQHCAAFCPYTAISLNSQREVHYKAVDYQELAAFFSRHPQL